MTHTHGFIDCEGTAMAISVTRPAGAIRAGVLLVSGGNEVRAGAHRGQAMLAERLATAGIMTLRYDRRGVGDSGGENRGFAEAGADMAAALAALRNAAEALPIIGVGNCDAASALLLHGAALPLAAQILANPWTLDNDDQDDPNDADPSHTASGAAKPLPSAAAIKARYLAKLRDPAALWALVTGGVNLRAVLAGLRKVATSSAPPVSDDNVAGRMAAALAATTRPTLILAAARDTTAMLFLDAYQGSGFAAARANPNVTLERRDSAAHSFAGDDLDLLAARITAMADQLLLA